MHLREGKIEDVGSKAKVMFFDVQPLKNLNWVKSKELHRKLLNLKTQSYLLGKFGTV